MAALFQYRPHVWRSGMVYTPDLLIARARMGTGNADMPLPVDRLTTAVALQQVGDEAHGMAALVVVGAGAGPEEGPLITLGSLHGAPDSPLACAKPICRQAWRLADVADHLDRLALRGWHVHGGSRSPATEETLSMPADDLAAVATESLVIHAARSAAAPAAPAGAFAAELHDPVTDRSIRLAYSIEILV